VKETILIVEDHLEIVTFLRNYVLEPMGFEVIWAPDGEEGLQAALEQEPDLILLDMSMPRMSGMEMLEALRTTNCDTPVIFMTMFGSEEIAAGAFRLGVRDYISKPFTIEEVERVVNRALREGRLAREKEELARNLVAAETVRQTVITLAHYINNYLLVVDCGLQLMVEALHKEKLQDPSLLETAEDSLEGAARISAVIRVLRQITDVQDSSYSEETQMIDIDALLRKELQQV
jgi:two-component system alkaline phosphatase synthesis response regulator PhoP